MTNTTFKHRITTEVAGIVEVEMTITDCAACSIVFAVPGRYLDERRKDHRRFYCPNGHSLSYGESEIEKDLRITRQRLESAQEFERSQTAALHRERRSHSATKGKLTKAKNKAVAGQCLKCRRHFVNVERHYETQHGDEEREFQLDD